MSFVEDQLWTVGSSLVDSDERMRSGRMAADRLWPTGFALLDEAIGGGLRAGSLTLLAGPQGLGKSTYALQLARNTARQGRPVVYFSYEHDAEDMTQKLIAMEAGEADESNLVRINDVRGAYDDLSNNSLETRLERIPAGLEALNRVAMYANVLYLHRSTGTRTDLEVIAAIAREVHEQHDIPPLLVIDYLQKVRVTGDHDEEERSTRIVEGLKDLSIDLASPVLAVAAADKDALGTGTRMRANNLRGSSALAYESDVVLVLNNKYDIVARHHLTYDAVNADRFREWAVLTVEKNRFGRDGVTMEFRTRFDQGRFEPEGQSVREILVGDRITTE
jgi:replicative DNA helicase